MIMGKASPVEAEESYSLLALGKDYISYGK